MNLRCGSISAMFIGNAKAAKVLKPWRCLAVCWPSVSLGAPSGPELLRSWENEPFEPHLVDSPAAGLPRRVPGLGPVPHLCHLAVPLPGIARADGGACIVALSARANPDLGHRRGDCCDRLLAHAVSLVAD